MSDHQKMVLEMVTMAATANALAEGEAIQFSVMKENVEKNGVKLKYWSDEMLATYEKTWQEVAAEMAGNDAFFKKVWDDLSTFREGYDLWERYAFLPRKRPE